MACHLHGASRLTTSLQAYANEINNGTSNVVVEGVSCLGQCDRPVAVSINDYVYRGKGETELRKLVDTALAHEKLPHQQADRAPLGWKIDPYEAPPPYEALKKFLADRNGDAILKALEVSNLRGMGGAGFPTLKKWAAVRGAPGDVKYIVCNADESEPGTFKDRELMRRTPHLLIEGMLLAGLITGAKQGYIYIRHEYHEEKEVLQEAINHAYEQELLGSNILGSGLSFPLEISVSPGGYIQGEQRALLEPLQDRRGDTRNHPPFPGFRALFG